jgi:hypothetical protein
MSTWSNGYTAGFQNKNPKTNPHPKGTPSWQSWQRGYLDGKRAIKSLHKGKVA